VSFGPVGLSIVVVAEATKEGEKPGFGTTKIINGISPATAEITDRFIGGVRDVDRHEVIGAEIFGEFHGIALIGLNTVTRFDRNERGGDDITADAHLEESTRDPKSTSTRFVANVEI